MRDMRSSRATWISLRRLGHPMLAVLALLASLATAPGSSAAAEMKQVFRSPDLPPGLPFSAAVRAGDTIYVSGAIGHARGEPRLVPGGVGPETEQAMIYIKETLERAGSSLDRVVKCTVVSGSKCSNPTIPRFTTNRWSSWTRPRIA